MYAIIGVLFYLAVVKKFEPLLLLPIAFGMLLANLPGANLINTDFFYDTYYITFDNAGEAVGVLSTQFNQFVDSIGEAYITFENGVGTINMTAIEAAGLVEEVEQFLATLPAETYHLNGNIYYINVLSQDAATSTALSLQIEQFISQITPAIHDNFYTVSNGMCSFDFATLGLEGVDVDYKVIFNETLGSVAKLEDGAVTIRLKTMVAEVVTKGGLIDFLYLGVKLGIYPSLIFMGVGAMTDFSPLIANPKSLFMGAGAQFGVFVAFFAALFLGFSPMQAASIGIIGGADGPTAILVTKTLAPELLGAIAIAAYSYMALIPIIQPPFMRLLTTKKERAIRMTNLRSVSTVEKVVFPILVTLIVSLIIPDAAPLVGFLMLGNLFNVSGVTDRLSKTSQNELCNIITICLGVSVGATANAANFLSIDTLKIIALGLCAFAISTCGGLLVGKIMCKLTGGKINPLIGSAGVSAVPMAARVAQDVGRKEDPSNFLLMHAMGPNVAGVIGSAVAAGVFLSYF
ncbi:MAG: sodium ion-translocating decarboxylase subunit beta [Clostridia bacterium]|nr:sodium ion-translocating decarboxylase subunit beta [Clostridia bacterium]